MVYKCAAFGCRSGYQGSSRIGKDGEKITFHLFPIGNPDLCDKWVEANPRKNFVASKHSKLCSLHFQPGDFIQEYHDTNVARRKKNLHKTPKRRYLKDGVIPSIFSNVPAGTYRSKAKVARRSSSGATLSTGYPNEVKRLESLEHASLDIEDISNLTSAEVEEQQRDQKYDIPLITTERVNQFMNITETLVKFRERGFLCDTLLVAKCGREVRAHSVLLAAVSPVFMMAIEEKPSSGTYHLCFPEVDLDVLDIAVHFVYTGKLLLPTVYSQMDLLSKLFDKLSDLGLSLQQLHECEKTFVRSAKQPPNSMTLSISVKVEDTDSNTNVKDSVQELQASCERSVDNKPSAEGFNEAMIIDVSPSDAGTPQIRPDMVEKSSSTLVKKNGQRICEQERSKRKHRKTSNKNCKKEGMPSIEAINNDNGAINPETQGDILNLVEPSPSPETVGPNNVEQLADEASSVGALNEDMALFDAGKSQAKTILVESTHRTFSKQKERGNREQERPKRKHRKNRTRSDGKERMPSSSPLFQRPAFSILRSLLGDLNASAAAHHSSVTGSQELNNLWASLLLDQTADKMNTLDSESYGVHEAIANDNGEPNLKTVDILNLVEPPLTEKTLQSNDADKMADKTSVSSEALTCEHCKEPNAETFRTEIELLWHKIKHHYGQSNVCCFCGRTSSSKENLRIHIKRHLGIHTRKNHKCNDCGLHFISPGSLKDHRARHTGQKPHECPDCKKRFTLHENMKRHRLLHSGYHRFLCDFCGKGFTRKTTLMEHVTLKHEFECALCSCKQTSKANMEKHAREVHQVNEHVKFSSIIKHTETHLCDLCGKNCTSAYSLRFHIQRHKKKSRLRVKPHTGERRFICHVCLKGFSYKTAFDYHFATHSGIKPFECDICSKSFPGKCHLKQHMNKKHMKQHTMTLSDKRRFKCGICNKLFTCKASVIEHNRIHTGEKPYKCEICSKQFICKSGLTAHIRIHTGEKPFACTECKMSFRQSHHLVRHMRTHTGERPFVCEICSKSYKHKVDLRYHLMRFHKIDATSKLTLNSIETNEKVKVPVALDSRDCIADELKHELGK